MKDILLLHPLLLTFIFASINWLLTLFGAALVYFVKSTKRKWISMATGMAAGVMFAASFFSLLLPAMSRLEGQSKINLFIIPLGFIIGALSIKYFSSLIARKQKQNYCYCNQSKMLMFAMTLHNIPEGFVVGVAFAGCLAGNYLPAIILSIGIGIQNFPEGCAISLPMHQSGKSKFTALMYGQLSALVEIPAAIIGFLFATSVSQILPFTLAFAAGTMVFVCVDDLIPEASKCRKGKLASISFIVGFVIMMTLDILLS